MITSINDGLMCYSRYHWFYENALELSVGFVVLIVIFIFVYLYHSTNWRPFKSSIQKSGGCSNCGKPLHYGSERCKWCGVLQLHNLDDTEPAVYSQERYRPRSESKQKERILPIPLKILALIVIASVVLILVFVFNVDVYCLTFLGIVILLGFLYLLTQGSTLGRKHQEGEAQLKQTHGRSTLFDKDTRRRGK